MRRRSPAWPSPEIGSAARRGFRAGSRPRATARRRPCRRRDSARTDARSSSRRPPQRAHGCVRTNSPNTLRETCCSRPVPPHFEHVVTDVPARRERPRSGRRPRRPDRHRPLDPLRRLDQLDCHLGRDVAPAGARRASGRPEEIVAEECREEVAQVAEVEVPGLVRRSGAPWPRRS